MIVEKSATLVERDPDLPGLAFVLDPSSALAEWNEVYAPIEIESARVEYVRYKPNRRCLVVYRMSSSTGDFTVIAQAHNGESWRKHLATGDCWSSERPPHSFQGASSEPQWFAQRQISWVRFPRDRRLRNLVEFSCQQRAQAFVRSILRNRFLPEQFHSELVCYKPLKRAVFRVRCGADQDFAFKMFGKAAFNSALARSRAWEVHREKLWDVGVTLPELRASSDRRRVLVTRWMKAPTLAARLANHRVSENDLFRVGAALAQLHLTPAELPEPEDQDLRVRQLVKLATDVAHLCPSIGDVAKRNACRLIQLLGDVPVRTAAIHGDFYAKQICLAEDRIGFLDFDQSVWGDPLRDVGNFIAKLMVSCQRGDMSNQKRIKYQLAFLKGYESVLGKQHDLAIKTHIAIGLFRCATDPFRNGRPFWEQEMADLQNKLDAFLTDRLFAREGFNLIANHDNFHSGSDCHDAQIAIQCGTGLDRRYPESSMAKTLIPERAIDSIRANCEQFRPFGEALKLVRAVPFRHKAGRRVLVRYDLQVTQSQSTDLVFSVIGKTRFKGVDETSYRLQSALRREGLNELQAQGIAVPQPLGIDPKSNTWFQACVPGETLEQIVSQETELQYDVDVETLSFRTVMAMRALHRSRPAIQLRRYGRDDELQSLCERLRQVSSRFPTHASRIERVIREAVAIHGLLSDDCTSVIHRDFYPAQILLSGRCDYLLDLDLCCRGPQLLDAGNYLGHLWELAIRRPHQSGLWLYFADAFSESVMDTDGSASKLPVALWAWAWMTLARHIWLSTRIEGRGHTTGAMIEQTLQKAAWIKSNRLSLI